ncbi:hypothetical protein RP20_CCG019584 [Aedes albopictus]|nr:hypothetical protein RP20_CCG019584 [Aedes albopictus]
MLLFHLHLGLTDNIHRILIHDILIDGSTPLEIPSNYSQKVRYDLNNVTIWNPTVDTYKLLQNRVKIFYLTNCSIFHVFLLPSMEWLAITNSNVSEIKIIHTDEIDEIATEQIKVRNASVRFLPIDINRLVPFKELQWRNNDIDSLDLAVLNGLKNLKYAVFTACSIKEVPNHTAVLLPSLCELELGHNQISHIYTTRWTMPELRTLNLENNQLTELPILNHFHKLQTLNLNCNLISSLNQYQLFQLKKLSTVILANNHISQLSPTSDIHFVVLTHLHLNGNQLERLDLRKWKSPVLKQLHVEKNQLRTIEGFEAIAGSLELFDFDDNPWDCEWVHFAMVDLEENLQLKWAKSC